MCIYMSTYIYVVVPVLNFRNCVTKTDVIFAYLCLCTQGSSEENSANCSHWLSLGSGMEVKEWICWFFLYMCI